MKKIKKITAAVCAAAILPLSGCGEQNSSTPTNITSSSLESDVSKALSEMSSAPESSEQSAPESSEQSAPESSAQSENVSENSSQSAAESAEQSIPEKPAADEKDFDTVPMYDGADKVCITKYKGSDTDVVIPSTIGGKTVVKIGREAFFENTEIRSVTIPETVEIIESNDSHIGGAFGYCSNLYNVYFKGDKIPAFDQGSFRRTPWFMSAISEDYPDERNFIIDTTLVCVTSGTSDTRTVPDYVTSINDYAFSNCKFIKEIIIPDSVQRIGMGAFSNCEGMQTIKLPKNLKKVESYLFVGCTSLVSVEIPEGVTSMGGNVFEGCKALKEIHLPNSVTELNETTNEITSQKLGTFNGLGDDVVITYKGKNYKPSEEAQLKKDMGA